jgi:bifunctional N-acetylglucosamine-1-phosphate-uridyltransferase/glucosamine-1-phosphate-acetyltransferase GlmU-like protein
LWDKNNLLLYENNPIKKLERQRNLVLIMAGGLGKRMNSDLPKVLHELNGLPLIVHVVKSALQMDTTSIIYIIVGKYREQIEKTINTHFVNSDYIRYINQPEPLGTGHAIQCCLPVLQQYNQNSRVLILSGDVPFFSIQSMREVMNNQFAATIVATQMEEPYGYGRIIQSPIQIVEEKDCTNEEKLIKLVNCGIYAFENEFLCQNLPKINNNNAQQEYYLTSIFSGGEGKVGLFEIPAEKQYEVCGINTPEQLEEMRSKTINNLL